jgi:serine/threonine protein kinase
MNSRDAPGAGDLDELVFRFLELQEQGRADALESLCAEHPALAPALRARVVALADSGLLDEAARDFPERIGDFRLLERLGQGGMGVVYRAEQESLKRIVALKLVRPELLYFPGARERFQREVLAVSRMSHPGIAPVFTVGEEAGIPFFAMELVQGLSLADVLEALQARRPAELSGADLERLVRARGGDLASSASGSRGKVFAGTWEQACVRIVQQVADALEHAHLREVLHRDVKPSNVMLGAGGRALLLDFGLSSLSGASRLTRSGSQIGSMPYMPPEVLRGGSETIDARTDVYSLGVTLYELLTLRLPYEGDSVQALMARVAAGQAVPPRRLNAQVSWEVETCCLTAMELEPARRYASAAAVARDLERALARLPLEARRASALLRTRRFVERHPAWSVGLVLGALLVVGGPLVYANQERRRRLDLEQANERVQAANVDLAAAKGEVESALAQVSLERDEVQRQFARAEANLAKAFEAVDVMLTKVGSERLAGLPRVDAVRRELLEEALAFHLELLEQAGGDAVRNLELARAHYRVAALQLDLARLPEAEDHLSEALDVLAGLRDDADRRLVQGQVLTMLGNVHLRQGRDKEADAAYSEAETFLVDAEGNGPANAFRAAVLYNQGVSRKRAMRFDEARDVLGRARAIELALLEERPGDVDLSHRCALTTMELGIVQRESLDPLGGVTLLQDALELQQVATRASPGTERYVLTTGKIQLELGTSALRMQQTELAARSLRDAALTLEPLERDHPEIPLYASLRAASLATLAAMTAASGDLEQACAETRQALEIFRGLVERNPGLADYKANLSQAESSLARRLARLGRTDEALATAERALDLQEQACAAIGDHPTHRGLLAARRLDMALVLVADDDVEGAREWVAAARELDALALDELRTDADFVALAADPRVVELLGD